MKPSILEFVTDPQLLGLTVSPAQAAILKTRTGEGLDAEEREAWQRMTGLGLEHFGPRQSMTLVAGARSGKGSRICAPLAVFESLFGGHERHTTKGETPVCAVFAQGQREAGIMFAYIRASLTESPMLRALVEDEPLKTELRLTNGVRIQTFPSTARAARGASIFAGIMDEVAWYRLEGSADSDAEVQNSIRRGTLGFPNPLVLKASTPFAKAGLLWQDFRDLFGQPHPDAICFHGATTLFNPSITAERLEVERRLDPSRFAREFLAEFAEDVDSFLPTAWVEQAVSRGVHERPPVQGVAYFAAADPSGAGADAFTLAIVHVEGTGAERRIVQDALRSWRSSRAATVDLEGIVRQAAELLRGYRCHEVVSDRYAAGWARQAWERAGVKVADPPGDRSAVYLAAEPLFATGSIDLLDHADLARELKALERRPQAGRIRVDHPRGHHDDAANATALAAVHALARSDVKRAHRVRGVELAAAQPLRHRGPVYGESIWKNEDEE